MNDYQLYLFAKGFVVNTNQVHARRPRHGRTDPTTSRDAAARVDEFASEHHEAILRAVAGFERRSESAPTYEQIADACGISSTAVGRRLNELVAAGKIACAGTGKTRSGRAARTWRTVPS